MNKYTRDSFFEKAVRNLIVICIRTINSITYKYFTIKNNKYTKKIEGELLGVYDLTKDPLSFDINTFVCSTVVIAKKNNLNRINIIIYAPLFFPVFQWQREKKYYNFYGETLIEASQCLKKDYILSIFKVSKLFPIIKNIKFTTDYYEVLSNEFKYYNIIKSINKFERTVNYRNYLGYAYNVTNKLRYDAINIKNYKLNSIIGHKYDGKIIVTVSIRNQKYSSYRNINKEKWENFFSHNYINKYFHFLIFNDAEYPIDFDGIENVTLLDKYITDNFRRYKLMLLNGLHIGSTTGSCNILSYSDNPYLWIGAAPIDDIKAHFHNDYSLIRGNKYFFDKYRSHQYFYMSNNNDLKVDDILKIFTDYIIHYPQTENFNKHTSETKTKLVKYVNYLIYQGVKI